jgi:anion-transporting  ArsA/GET3 family ATPase
VSTDPASNLDEVLGLKLSNAPQAIPGLKDWTLSISIPKKLPGSTAKNFETL